MTNIKIHRRFLPRKRVHHICFSGLFDGKEINTHVYIVEDGRELRYLYEAFKESKIVDIHWQ